MTGKFVNVPRTYDAAIKKSLKDSRHVTILLRHGSVNRKKITFYEYEQFEVCFIKIGAILDFDPLYKFEMTFDL